MGPGLGSLGERYGSHVGQYIIQRSIMFPVQAIDHEDTRYFRSTRASYKGRLPSSLRGMNSDGRFLCLWLSFTCAEQGFSARSPRETDGIAYLSASNVMLVSAVNFL
jgi:hypothetical protein